MMRKRSSLFSVLLLASLVLPAQTELLGPLTQESILKGVPDWEAVASAYNPRPDVLQKIRAVGQPVRIEIFLGTWCPDSKAHVGAYFKIMEMADNPLIQTFYIGIPKDKSARAKYLPPDKAVEKLPTFLVYRNGSEIGRIIETPARSVEEDLLAILSK